MGSAHTFDVSPNSQNLEQLFEVMQIFFDQQGRLIDTSPMYGNAEIVLGRVMSRFAPKPVVFNANKVWTWGQEEGIKQMLDSSKKMDVPVFDLMQIHNLRDWKAHLETLKRWKDEGKVRYIGITTSHQRNHRELDQIMRREPLDFVQFSYNIENRIAEERLLPTAADRGIATVINRPFQRGKLFEKSKGKPLPGIAKELECASWGQFYLKFLLHNPAITCLIPATSKVEHMRDNMQANFGPIPDANQRMAMISAYDAL